MVFIVSVSLELCRALSEVGVWLHVNLYLNDPDAVVDAQSGELFLK
jgi:hypothetical protein